MATDGVCTQLARCAAGLQRLAGAAQRTSFALLDVVVDATPVEDRRPASWEIERERFLRGLPDYEAEDSGP